MIFNPEIHTKTFLLANPDVAISLALKRGTTSFDDSFALSDVAQDYDVLSINDGEVAYAVSANTQLWSLSPAAQELKVLALRNGRVATNISSLHCSDRKTWAETPAAQEPAVLSLQNGTVARNLANSSRPWSRTKAAQDLKTLSLQNGNVARHLALRSKSWAKTPAAKNMDVLRLGDGQVLVAMIQKQHDWFNEHFRFDYDMLTLNRDVFRAIQERKELALSELLVKYIVADAHDGLNYNAIKEKLRLGDITNSYRSLKEEAASLCDPVANFIVHLRAALSYTDMHEVLKNIVKPELENELEKNAADAFNSASQLFAELAQSDRITEFLARKPKNQTESAILTKLQNQRALVSVSTNVPTNEGESSKSGDDNLVDFRFY